MTRATAISSQLIAALAAYIPRDRVAQLLGATADSAADGVALIADISGFTPLTEALTTGLSADQGAEELTRALDSVFAPLVQAVHRYHGSVLKFGGDALIVWYPRARRQRRAAHIAQVAASALEMQAAIHAHGTIATPIGPVTLRMKIGMAHGPLRRFVVGRPEIGLEDAPVGATLDRMAEAEHHAEPGEIIADAATAALAQGALLLGGARDGFAVIGGLRRRALPRPWPALSWPEHAAAEALGRLAPFVPGQITRTLAAGRTQIAELRPVVSMFVQFEGIDYDGDRRASAQLQRYFTLAQDVCERYGGRVNRLITGDKGSLLHVIFGAPIAVEEQELRALRCAIDLQASCGRLPQITTQRIGIAGGRVFAGPVGGPERHDYTTMGDSINLSARLMQGAPPGGILAEARVAERAGPAIGTAGQRSIRVKGKAEPIEVVEIVGLQARAPRGTSGALIGRDAELAELRGLLDAVSDGQGAAAALVGELGMGKSLLLEALRAARSPEVRWLSASCLAYGQPASGSVLIELIYDLLDLPPGAGPEQARAALHALCADLFGDAQVGATRPYLARLLGLTTAEDERRLAGLAGESVRWRLAEVIADLIRRSAARGPLVIAVDDLQWADATSRDLLAQIAPLARSGLPLLLILAMRPEADAAAPPLPAALRAQLSPLAEITLRPLDQRAALELLRQVAPELPAALAEQLERRAGGNPLFLVELARTLEAHGLAGQLEQLSDAAITTLGLPESIEGLLVAQIDRLIADARHVLQIASVIGPTFLERVLSALAAGEAQLDARLRDLVGEQFIIEDTDHDPVYHFRHLLIQQSAYGTLLYERRRSYHRSVAAILEQLFPAQQADQPGLLAHHYERAGDLDRAAALLAQAADSARLLAANQEAEALYRRALDLLGRAAAAGAPDQPARRARLHLRLAQVRANQLDFAGAQEWYEQAFALLDAQAPGGPRPDHAVRLGIYPHGPTTLDPGLLNATDVSEIVPDLFEGLVELDPDLNVVPAAARRWSVSADGLRYRFELRPGLQWSDGAPLSADDFLFAWRRNLDPASAAPQAYQLTPILGAAAVQRGEAAPEELALSAPDALTLELALEAPCPHLLYILATPIAYPQPAHAIARHGPSWSAPERIVGNGPYAIAQWVAGEQILLQRSPTYRGRHPGNIESATLLLEEPSLAAYRAGRVDMCIIEGRADALAEAPGQRYQAQHLATYFLAFDCRRPPFSSRALRQLLAGAIDRQALVEQVWAGVQRPAHGGVIPPGLAAHSPELALAREAADAAELRGAPLVLAAPPGFEQTPAFLRERLAASLGVDLQIRSEAPIEEILGDLASGAAQLALIGWDLEYPDPANVLGALFYGERGAGYFGWQSDRFDQLIDQAARSDAHAEQLAHYRAADRLLVADEAAIVPLYYQQSLYLLHPGLGVASESRVLRTVGVRLKYLERQSAPE